VVEKRQPIIAKSQQNHILQRPDWPNCALISQLTGFLAVPF
jgi:hypothetical protein